MATPVNNAEVNLIKIKDKNDVNRDYVFTWGFLLMQGVDDYQRPGASVDIDGKITFQVQDWESQIDPQHFRYGPNYLAMTKSKPDARLVVSGGKDAKLEWCKLSVPNDRTFKAPYLYSPEVVSSDKLSISYDNTNVECKLMVNGSYLMAKWSDILPNVRVPFAIYNSHGTDVSSVHDSSVLTWCAAPANLEKGKGYGYNYQDYFIGPGVKGGSQKEEDGDTVNLIAKTSVFYVANDSGSRHLVKDCLKASSKVRNLSLRGIWLTPGASTMFMEMPTDEMVNADFGMNPPSNTNGSRYWWFVVNTHKKSDNSFTPQWDKSERWWNNSNKFLGGGPISTFFNSDDKDTVCTIYYAISQLKRVCTSEMLGNNFTIPNKEDLPHGLYDEPKTENLKLFTVIRIAFPGNYPLEVYSNAVENKWVLPPQLAQIARQSTSSVSRSMFDLDQLDARPIKEIRPNTPNAYIEEIELKDGNKQVRSYTLAARVDNTYVILLYSYSNGTFVQK